jgi:peptidoglycan/LPS O-acetylase OafA/YrhL
MKWQWEWLFLASVVPLWLVAAVYGGLLEKRFPTATPAKGNQIEALEILRGLAAFVVFLAHVTMYFGGLAPGSRASSYLGDLGVIIFFMLTGFLFWGQILNGRLALDSFFQKRVKRLVPLCLFVVATATTLDWVQAGFPLPNLGQVQAAARNFGFGFVPVHDVFSPDMYLRINTIWSLRWEWLFYLLLPLFAVKRSWAAMTLGTLAISVLFFNVRDLWTGVESESCFVIAFYLGALGNLLAPGGALSKRLPRSARLGLATALGVAFLSLSLATYFTEGAAEARVRHLGFVLIASLLFFVFPLLSDVKQLTSGFLGKASMHLGRISYSLYLWQLLVIYYVIRGGLKSVDLQSAGGYAGVVVLLTFLIVTVSHFSYRYVELPFLRPDKGLSGVAVAPGTAA